MLLTAFATIDRSFFGFDNEHHFKVVSILRNFDKTGLDITFTKVKSFISLNQTAKPFSKRNLRLTVCLSYHYRYKIVGTPSILNLLLLYIVTNQTCWINLTTEILLPLDAFN